MIKNYFSFFNKNLERKIRAKRLLLRLRRLSSNRVYLSNGEFKHTNNSVLINIYMFNRQKHNYILKLRKIYINKLVKKSSKINVNKNVSKRLKSIYEKGLECLKESNSNKYLLIKALNLLEKNKNFKIKCFKSLSNYTESFYKRLLKHSLKNTTILFI